MKDLFYTEELFFEKEENPFLLPEEDGSLPFAAGPSFLFSEERYVSENLFQSESHEQNNSFWKMQHSLFKTEEQKTVNISPQIFVEVSAPQPVSAERLAEEIKEKICREIYQELGGYFSW